MDSWSNLLLHKREHGLWVSRGLNHTKRQLEHDQLLLEDATKVVHSDGIKEFLDSMKDQKTITLEKVYLNLEDKIFRFMNNNDNFNA